MSSLAEQLQTVRQRAEVCLYSGGRVDDLWLGVTHMAKLPLPPCIKYHRIAAETMVVHNSVGSNRKEVRWTVYLPDGRCFCTRGVGMSLWLWTCGTVY